MIETINSLNATIFKTNKTMVKWNIHGFVCIWIDSNIFYVDTQKLMNVSLEAIDSIVLKLVSSYKMNLSKESNVSQLMKFVYFKRSYVLQEWNIVPIVLNWLSHSNY